MRFADDVLKRNRAPKSALKDCDACGGKMAKGARACPHCGKSYTTAGGVFIAIVIGLILAGWVFS